jgi:hypothetical protein
VVIVADQHDDRPLDVAQLLEEAATGGAVRHSQAD